MREGGEPRKGTKLLICSDSFILRIKNKGKNKGENKGESLMRRRELGAKEGAWCEGKLNAKRSLMRREA